MPNLQLVVCPLLSTGCVLLCVFSFSCFEPDNQVLTLHSMAGPFMVIQIHKSFRVRSPSLDEKSYDLALASTLESQEGTPEAV